MHRQRRGVNTCSKLLNPGNHHALNRVQGQGAPRILPNDRQEDVATMHPN